MMAMAFGPSSCPFGLVPKSKLLHSPEDQNGFVPKLSLHGGKNIALRAEKPISRKAAIEREESEVYFDFPECEQARAELKEFFRAQAKHLETKFKGDYTQIPRGRVAWTIDKFIVLVGKWAEPIQEELTALLEAEFSLPYFEFVYDEHWDLGHGWSGDMPK